MKKNLIFVVTLIILSFSVYAEEVSKVESADIVSKITEIESSIKKMADDIKKMEDEIQEIKKSIKILSSAIRDLQIYTQGGASIKPDEDTWKSIKRGMTDEEVKDILGIPEEISVPRQGGEVWYYYGLGSITFDRNGKVISQQTFKQIPVERKTR